MGKLGFGRNSTLSALYFHGLCGSKRFIGAITQIRTFSDGTTLDDGGPLSLDRQATRMPEHGKVGFGQNSLTTMCSRKFGVSSGKVGFAGGKLGLGHSTLSTLSLNDFCGSKRWVGAVMMHIRTFSDEPTLDDDRLTLDEEGGLSLGGDAVPMSEKTVTLLIKYGFYDVPTEIPSDQDLLHQIQEDDIINYENPSLPISGFYARLTKNGTGIDSILSPSDKVPEYPEFTLDLPIYRHLVLMYPGFDIRRKYWLPFEGSQLTFWEHEFKGHNVYKDSILFYTYFEDVSRTSENYLQEEGEHSLPTLLECYKQTLASLLKREPVSTHTGLELLRLLSLRFFGRSISTTNREHIK